MNIEIKQGEKNNKSFEILAHKNSIKSLVLNKDCDSLFISFETLNLAQKLYGQNKSESKVIQRVNSKQIIKLFRICKKAIKILLKRKTFCGVIYVNNLDSKLNNNDYMLKMMLEISLFVKRSERLKQAISSASEYLLLENNMNNMCDFKNNICAKHRSVMQKHESFSGCCPVKCKFNKKSICQEKCLACKIFMCNYLIEKGYYFDVHGIAVLQQNLTAIERVYLLGLLFTSLKMTVFYIRLVRLFENIVFLFFVAVLVLILYAM